MVGPVEAFQLSLEGLASTEARLAASLGLLLLAALVSFVLAPLAVRRSLKLARREMRKRRVEEAIESIDDVAEAPKPDVLPMAFDDSAITLECRFWIRPPTARAKWRTRAAVIRSIRSAFDREGIDIPFPQRTLGRRIGTDESHPSRASSGLLCEGFTYADEQ